MQDQLITKITTEQGFTSPERRSFEAAPIHQITDEQMLGIAACPGVLEKFDFATLHMEEDYHGHTNAQTHAKYIARQGNLRDRDGRQYAIEIQRDLDTLALIIALPSIAEPVIKIGLRDRTFDGTPGATPPKYLQRFDGITSNEIPPRSFRLGVNDWHYSRPRDIVEQGRRAVELSIRSSDPDHAILQPLVQPKKKDSLWVPPDKLAQFITNPYSHIPDGNPPNPQELDKWYSMWWQVANRVLRGKTIPFPGQTATQAFDGFMEHVVTHAAAAAKEIGYTHLSAVPTWQHVWTKFQRLGFRPDHHDIHEKSTRFFDSLANMPLLHITRRQHLLVRDFVHSRALLPWLAVLPYAIQKDPSHVPHLPIPDHLAQGFYQVFNTMKSQVVRGEDVLTYPLAPGNNVWYSLPLRK